MANANYYGHPANTRYTGKLEIYETNNVASNNSTIVWYFKVYRNDGYNSSYSRATGNHVVVTMNGTTVCDTTECGTVRAPNGEAAAYTLASGTATIPHNSDGSKSFSFNATYTNANSDSISPLTVSGTHTCNTIPRASGVSAPDFTLGSAGTITISPASSSFRHTLTYSFHELSGTIATNVASSRSFTPPLSWANQIPNATSSWGTITCITYSGSAEVGRSSCTFHVTVPSSVVPTISSLSAARVNGDVPSSWGIYVQGKSKVTLTINGAAGAYGSTIKRYVISGGGFSGSSSSLTTGFLSSSGTITFSAYVVDSRGRQSATKTVSISVVAYSSPSLSGVSTYRCNSGGTADEDGTYFRAYAGISFASCSGKNSVSCTVKYKASNGSSWTTAGALSSQTAAVFGGGGLNAETSYDVRYELSDAFTTVTYDSYVSSAFFLMHFKRGGKGMAIGKTAETDNLFEVGLPATFNDTVKTEGELNFLRGHYVHSANGTSGSAGYVKIANIQVKGQYSNSPFMIEVTGRGRGISTRLFIAFNNSASTTPTLHRFRYWGANCNAYMYHNGSGLWYLYVQKSESYDQIDVVDFYLPPYMRDGIAVTWTNVHASSVPSGAEKATTALDLFGGAAASHSHSYLPLGGGELTGNVVLQNNKGFRWRSNSDNSWIYSPANQDFRFRPGEPAYEFMMGVYNNGGTKLWSFCPTNTIMNLGTSSYRWGQLYATTGSINTSDRNEKNTIREMDPELWERFVMGLKPCTYKFNEGTSGRKHSGMVAQDVEALMERLGIDSQDFAGFIKFKKEAPVSKTRQVVDEEGNVSEETYEDMELVLDEDGNQVYGYGLRYDEFIAPLIQVVQNQAARIADLTARLEALEEKLAE